MNNRSDIERVREQVDLVALISEFVPLEQKGREWMGVCPFHDDHKPSMHVVTHREQAFYKCFSCGASGDCFKFVQEYLKKDFGEALQFLADRYGIELSKMHSIEGQTTRSKIRSAMQWALKRYVDALSTTPEGANARAHLNARGFTDETISQFLIGVSPDSWTFLTSPLHNNAERIETALDAGLLKKNEEKNRVYDAFRHRIMFPIVDETGSPIAFGARRLDENDEPKYINSPETTLFSKSKTLYGYNLARIAIQTNKKAIVVEGYTDVIACHQAGITNVVATLGTALTTDHAAKLSRICDEVILIFDGDNAGQLAADRAVEIFFLKNIDVQICVLPEGKDPADLATNPSDFEACVDEAVDALTFKFNRLNSSLLQETTISGKSKLIDTFLNELTRLGVEQLTTSRKSLVYERIASLLSIPMDDVGKELRSRRPAKHPIRDKTEQRSTEVKTIPPAISRARQIAEREFLSILLFEPAETSAVLRESKTVIRINDFLDPISKEIAVYILPRLESGTLFTMAELTTELNSDCENVATTLYFVGERICNTYESVMHSFQMTKNAFVNAIEKQAIDEEVKSVQTTADVDQKTQAAKQAIDLIRRQQEARNAS